LWGKNRLCDVQKEKPERGGLEDSALPEAGSGLERIGGKGKKIRRA